jgi:AraC family transcriptional regulator of adaptative response / DNA-3-methyladenine glycosylase II
LREAALEELGLPARRAEAIRALATTADEDTMSIASLTELPGIGDWTAQYIALRGAGEPDAFPAGDLVLRRRASNNGRALDARRLESIADAWRPWRGYAAMLLWCAS